MTTLVDVESVDETPVDVTVVSTVLDVVVVSVETGVVSEADDVLSRSLDNVDVDVPD